MFGPFTEVLAYMGFIFVSLVVIIALGLLITSTVDASKERKKKRWKEELERQYNVIARDLLEGRITRETAKVRIEALDLKRSNR